MEINYSKNIVDNQQLILFDSSATLKDLMSILKNQNIITFDYESHELLLKNKITHKTSEDYLKEKNFDKMQKLSYDLSMWYKNKSISDEITYDELNLGGLFYVELHYHLVPLIKKFIELQDVLSIFEKAQFMASPFMYELLCCMDISYKTKFGKTTLVYDSLYDNIKIRLTNSYQIKLSHDNYLKLKKISEKIFRILINTNKVNKQKSFLFAEFDPIKYKKLLSTTAFDHTVYLFNRRRPAIYNLKSFNIIKKSKIKIISSNISSNKNIENIFIEWNKKLDELLSNDEFFNNFFSINNISFWKSLKSFFINLCKRRFHDAILEIEISKKVLSKHKFHAVIVWSESGFNEQIIIHYARRFGIPIILLQHGLYYDSIESFEFNKFVGVLPINSDIVACWGESFYSSLLKWGFSPEKIRIVGNPSYDDVFGTKRNSTSDNKYILLATSSPTNNIMSDLSNKTRECYFNSIKKICETIFNSKKKFIIKLHPFSEEIDITSIAKNISPDIQIIKYGNIINLIKDCELFITIDISTTMLEAQIFEKPIISMNVKNYNFVDSTILNSCIIANLDNFENIFNQLLNDPDFKKRSTIPGNKFVSNYIHFQNSSSEEFIKMLDTI